MRLIDYLKNEVDKAKRQRKREERLKNLSPITKKYAGFLKNPNGGSYTDEDIDRIKYEYLQEKYGYNQ